MPQGLCIRVDVERDADRIHGHVVTEDGPARPFAGWTELFAALQTVIADDVHEPEGS
jgi:hypothetical protein